MLLDVVDTGGGMDAETQAKIFDPFFTTKFTGRGLGLAIVKSAATANGGRAWVTDPADGGPGVVVGFSVGPSSDSPVFG